MQLFVYGNLVTGRQINILEGHTNSVICVSFSSGGHLLGSKSHDGTVRCWRTDRWETVAILNERLSKSWNTGLAFHPKAPILATLSEEDINIRIWTLDPKALLGDIRSFFSVHYTNAKVVLVGDTGVGKSGLGLVLTGQQFMPTESTHGRNVWMFDSEELVVDEGKSRLIRETLLWDLAGQPGYRLIHQLHLNEIAVALVVFDNRNETDPLAGIDHWVRALRQGQHSQGNAAPQMKMFLVAARIDRSGRGTSTERIKKVVQKWGFDGYFETSAKEKWNIQSLAEAIRKAIQWESLPKVSSTDLFQLIKNFLHSEIGSGNILSTEEHLYRQFLASYQTLKLTKNLRQQFNTCIGRVESRGLIRRLSFGNLILLQPEILDAYASALVNAVKTEPDGLGCISEEKAKAADFALPTDARLKDEQQEKLLLIAMIENLLHYEIALREPTEQGPQLVFPSQSTRENPTLVDPEGKTVLFRFEGSVTHIYATLAVRLSHSGFFQKETVWKNAIIYTTKRGGTYGLLMKQIDEGIGEFVLFFDMYTSEDMRYHFEEYVHAHLRRRVAPENIQRRSLFSCPKCIIDFTEAQVPRRLEKGYEWIRCSVCDTKVFLQENKWVKSSIPAMDKSANSVRDKTIIAFIQESLSAPTSHSLVKDFLEVKIKSEDFDVFLCYRKEDKLQVKEIGERLKEKGILPWLEEWELQPGLPWQRILEQQLRWVKSAAVFVGEAGIGPWQHFEIECLLRQFVERGCPVIPVLLSDAPAIPSLPLFLEGMTWVDFRVRYPEPIEQLIWGITGERGMR